MASARTKFTVGLFMAAGLMIGLILIIWLGVTRVFEPGTNYLTFFNESVQGLNKDSQVKYRGVPVGRVEDIGVAPDSNLVQVLLKLDMDQVVGDGLVSQLKPVGITGSMFIELDRARPHDRELSPEITFPTRHPVIPSKPSTTSEIIQGVDRVLVRINRTLEEADVKGLSEELKLTLASVRRITDNPGLVRSIESLERNGKALEQVLARADKSVDRGGEVIEDIGRLIRENELALRQTMEALSAAASQADRTLDEGDQAVRRIEQRFLRVLGQLERAGAGADALIDSLRDQPSQIIFRNTRPERPDLTMSPEE
jgi:phospholipid/cholesterol/gamma-HCH transport system substrate-binding protein